MKKINVFKSLWFVVIILSLPLYSVGSASELLAGTAKINITSSSEMPLHDSLYARVLLLENNEHKLAFVALDQGIFTSDNLVKMCKEELGISQVLISSSHTHSSGKRDTEYVNSQILNAIQKAGESMFPARISAGSRTFPQLGFNRLMRIKS